ncbi:MAG: HAMP domain-containing histidine kinase [Candidatus Omnitrophica bacterium]|nr:HAMP domain-containing histidine kinase [Candidatus Omnitrophota bacterium]
MIEPSRAELKYLVERQREEIKTVNEVARLLSTTTDPDEIIRLVASYLRQTFPLALCGVLLSAQRKLHVIQFAKISQVDVATAIRDICAKASEQLAKPMEAHTLTRVVEDQSAGAGQWVQASVGYLRSHHFAPLAADGQTVGLLSVFSGKAEAFTNDEQHVIDIVASQLRAALRNAFLLDELRRANELKNELLMVISHELRIPLTSIQEGVSLILDGSLGTVNAEQQEFLKTVDTNADRLQALVEKVVTATRLVTAQLAYTYEELELATLLQELEGLLRPLAEQQQVRLSLTAGGGSTAFRGDGKHLTQALRYVVENAIQASRPGGQVTVEGTPTPRGLDIHVSDTGAGIPPDALPTLFERFRFVGGVDNRKTGGLGLGLFIAKAIVTAHGGTIQLETQVSQGTRVTISLPKTPPEPEQAQA